ncbi:LuxR C-terminal-related transcriptional regulator [Streptantibioticus rubrisoli]|uniref:Helix-turn-helix transcriptional regulator n=2 Tax=Streptantibioticus rubrisoli TaxID=1387313 RepID=A0ABT1P916_9ACTN|nr:helix-turn-helix transcriptional regulator [Streptantibioticus rubrisoli]MCQ4041296.1 helix-turn-helix transcriptional regulator [Streptantibioticus rubrisoli]
MSAVHEAMTAIYKAVLLNGPMSTEELLRPPGTAAARARAAALDQLRALHLLHPLPGRPDVLAAASPLVAESRVIAPLQDEVSALQHRLRQLYAQLEPLQAVHDLVRNARADAQSLVPLEDPAEITSAIEAAARSCEHEVLTAQPGGPRSERVLEEALPRDIEMLSRGVRMRTVYQHSARFSLPTQAYVERVSSLGCEVRTLDEFFRRLLVFDRRTAFIPDAEDDAKAVLIRQPSVVAFLVNSFQRAWDSALPFTSAYENRANRAVSSAMQRSIARLMLSEDKDSAIARRLGISERTCRAHIAKIMKRLGARNRTHLGYLLATTEPYALESMADG